MYFVLLGSLSSHLYSQELSTNYKNLTNHFKPYNLYVSKKKAVLRTNPTTYSMEIAVLDKGENVKVLYKNPHKIRIGLVEDYWYYVQTSKNYIGWIFGSFLGSSSEFVKDDFVNKNIVISNIKGIWWEINERGETEYRSFQFNPEEKKFVYKFQNTNKIEGEFNINEKGIIVLNKDLPIGKELEFIETPEGYRLIAQKKDKIYYFKKSNMELPEQENDR